MHIRIVAVAAMGLALGACNFTPAEQALLQTDLNIFCPGLATADPLVRPRLNGNARVALDDLELACPPNPPPTNAAQIIQDVALVGVSILPYLHSPRQRAALAHAQDVAAAHGMAPAAK